MYLLDTDVISSLRRPERSPRVVAWLNARDPAELYLSVLTIGEIERGIRQQARVNPAFSADLRGWLERTVVRFADRIMPFDMPAARLWGTLSAELGNARTDLMIAASALTVGATLATGDAGQAASGVRIENPFA